MKQVLVKKCNEHFWFELNRNEYKFIHSWTILSQLQEIKWIVNKTKCGNNSQDREHNGILI